MTIPTNPQEHFSPFLPSTFNAPEEPDRLKSFLGEKFSQFSDVINDKKIGNYLQSFEVRNGNNFGYDVTSTMRHGYSFLVRILTYPNNTTVTLPVPPDINNQFVVSQVWGSASKPPSALGAGDGDYFSFFGSGNSKITFTMSDTQIVVTTTQNMTAYTGFIIIEYIRNGT